MTRTPLTIRLALLGLLVPAVAAAGEIPLDAVVIEEGEVEAVVEHVPWSGSWWSFQAGKLAFGYHGDECFTYDEDAEDFTPVVKPDNDLAPLQKYDLFVERRHGENPGAAYLELKGDEDRDFHHHVYGERKRKFDDEGVSYGWWGHCNGWAAAALMEREPQAAIVAEDIRFDVADLKGMLTEVYWGVRSDFTGRRYNKPSDELRAKVERGQELLDKLGANDQPDVADYIAWYEDIFERTLDDDVKATLAPEDFKNSLEHVRDWAKENWEDAYEDILPHIFHKILVTQIKNKRAGVVFDTSADEEVWNFPAYYFKSQVTFVEDTQDGGKKYEVETTVYYAHDGVSESILGVNRLDVDYTYTLITDADGHPIGGEWTGGSVDEHPDFAWLPTYNPTGPDTGENHKVEFGKVLQILQEDHSHGERVLELAAVSTSGDTVRQSQRIGEQETSTWSDPVAVESPVQLSVEVQGAAQGATRVAYYEQALTAGWSFPTVDRDGLTLLGEVSGNGGSFAGSYPLPEGKRHLVAKAYGQDGRLLAVSELTVEVANGNTPPPPPPAGDDTFEQNDSRDAAASIAPGTHPGLRCADDDWFKVEVTQGQSVEVRIEFSHSEGDLDLAVSHGQSSIGSSTSTSNQEVVTGANLAAGEVFVRVYGYSGAQADYDLTVTVSGGGTTPPPPANDDAFEENDTQATAAVIAAGTHDLQVRDDDWFAVDLGAGQRAVFVAAFNHGSGDIDMSAHAPSGQGLGSSTSTSDQERVELVASAAGTYAVRVYGYNGATNDVRLTVTVENGTTPPPPTSDDAFEENDSQASAATLSLGNHANLRADDDDWFRIDVPQGATLTVVVSFDHGEGDLDVSLHQQDGTRLEISQGTSNEERIVHSGGGPVFLRVYGYDGARADYSVDVTAN